MTVKAIRETGYVFLPRDWRGVVIHGQCEKVTKGTTPTSVGRLFTNAGINFVKAESISENGTIIAERLAHIDPATHAVFRRSQLEAGDLLISIAGVLGRVGRVRAEDLPANTNQALAIVRLRKDSELDRDYLFFALRSAYVRRQVADSNVRAAQANLSLVNVRNLTVPLPPKYEQRAIASVLADCDALIASLDGLISKKRELKQAVTQQLLTAKTRLPGFKGPWATRRIGEFTQCVAGGTPNTMVSEYWGGSVRWMSSGELHLKRVTDVAGRITEKGLRNSNARILPKDCVLIGLAGQGKTRGTVALSVVELSTNQSIAAVLPSPSFCPEYLYYNLDSRYQELRDLSGGGTGRGGLNIRTINTLKVPLPSLAEQRAIARSLVDIDAELAALELRRDKTKGLKQAMMQELLSGRTRLKTKEPALA